MKKTETQKRVDATRKAFRYIRSRAKELGYNVSEVEEREDAYCTYFRAAINLKGHRVESSTLEVLASVVRGAGALYYLRVVGDRLEMGIYEIIYKEDKI